jgi:hemoglobin
MKPIKSKAALCAAVAAAFVAIGCSTMAPAPMAKMFKDGEMPVPADYKSWTKKFSEIQRPDLKQVREVWVNATGANFKGPGPLPNGYVSVMEIWSAAQSADGQLAKGADGKLVKGKLAKVFVMGKGAGWGESVTPAELRNGDWVYSAWLPDMKTAAPDSPAACRACHLPLKDKDFMPRYDETYTRKS